MAAKQSDCKFDIDDFQQSMLEGDEGEEFAGCLLTGNAARACGLALAWAGDDQDVSSAQIAAMVARLVSDAKIKPPRPVPRTLQALQKVGYNCFVAEELRELFRAGHIMKARLLILEQARGDYDQSELDTLVEWLQTEFNPPDVDMVEVAIKDVAWDQPQGPRGRAALQGEVYLFRYRDVVFASRPDRQGPKHPVYVYNGHKRVPIQQVDQAWCMVPKTGI